MALRGSRVPVAVLLLAAAVGAALSGCGGTAPPALTAARATPSSIPPDPAMVMIRLSDRGYRVRDVDVVLGQPLMLMVMNGGTRSHRLAATVPMSGMQIDDPAAPQPVAGDPSSPASRFDLSAPPGSEVDVSFTPTAAGRYDLSDGASIVGVLVVS